MTFEDVRSLMKAHQEFLAKNTDWSVEKDPAYADALRKAKEALHDPVEVTHEGEWDLLG